MQGTFGAQGTQPLRRLRVLLVDSDPGFGEKMTRALGVAFVLQHTASVAEAKRALLEMPPDVLICEVRVGQESGLDLCRYVRGLASLQHIPIMLLTSLATLPDKIAGFDAGADDYVVKPFDPRQLMARLRLLVRLKRLQYSPEDVSAS